jgi:Mce-associated membrane protein
MAIDADSSDGKLSELTTYGPDPEAAEVDGPDEGHTEPDGSVSDSDDPPPDIRLAIAVGLVTVVALAGVMGWLGYRAYESHQAQQQRNLFLQVARQGALNLTTINHTEADADVQRILDSATGTFYDDFQKRSQPFIVVVKRAQSKSEGSIIEAGLESEEHGHAQVLVAVNVNTSLAGVAEPNPRAWRMRMSVQTVGDGTKVSNVEFVP